MITRRGLLSAAFIGLGGILGWDLSRDGHPTHANTGFCPDDEYLSNHAFVTGRLRLASEGPFEPEEAISLVAAIHNRGGAASRFNRSLDAKLYDPEKEMVTKHERLTTVDRPLPPESTTKIRINVAAPTAPGIWWLDMGDIAVSCDLIAPLREEIEVVSDG